MLGRMDDARPAAQVVFVQGWRQLYFSRTAHWFRASGRSLCDEYRAGEPDDGGHTADAPPASQPPPRCKTCGTCRRRLEELRLPKIAELLDRLGPSRLTTADRLIKGATSNRNAARLAAAGKE